MPLVLIMTFAVSRFASLQLRNPGLFHLPLHFPHDRKISYLIERCRSGQAQGLNAKIDYRLHGGIGEAAILTVARQD
jgi:hypothetical protein